MNARGLTLLEMLICLAILGILTALAVPTYNHHQQTNHLQAAAEAVAADLRWARSEALKRNIDINLIFSPSASPGSPWAYDIRTSANTLLKTVSSSAIPDFTAISLTESLRSHTTGFSSLRGSSEGKNGKLVLSSADGALELQVIVSILGRVSICHAEYPIGDYPACN